MKVAQVVFLVSGVLFVCGISIGQISHETIPLNPQQRIVNGQIYNPQNSRLWVDIATNIVERCSGIRVTSIGQTSLVCSVHTEVLDDGGLYGVYRVIGQKHAKTVVLYNHPLQEQVTTGAALYEGGFSKRGDNPLTRPFLAMRVKNYKTNDLVFEAFDFGLPDTIENRKKAFPTTSQVSSNLSHAPATSLK